MITFGEEPGLQISLVWDQRQPGGNAARATSGSLALSVEGQTVWGGPAPGTGFRWTWVDLLHHLATAWPELLWFDGLPFGLRPEPPAKLWSQAEGRWVDRPASAVDEEASDLEAFLETHDLARGVQGAVLPAVLVVREGNLSWICTDAATVARPLSETIGTLEALCDAIAGRVAGLRDPRAGAIHDESSMRLALDLSDRVAIATGLDRPKLAAVQGDADTQAMWELSTSKQHLSSTS